MTTIDIVIFALIGFGIIKGLYKGLLAEVASIAALLIGSYGAVHFSNFTNSALIKFLNWPKASINILAFIITFLVIVLSIIFIGKVLTKLVKVMSLGIINRLLGGVFGGLKIALLISVLILVLNNFSITKLIVFEDKIKKSISYTPIESIAPAILPAFIKQSNQNDFLKLEKDK
jgi:membrane protein required for colicin V production